MIILKKLKIIHDLQNFDEVLHFYQTINLKTVCTFLALTPILQVAILFGLDRDLCLELKMKLHKNMVFTQKLHLYEMWSIDLNISFLES